MRMLNRRQFVKTTTRAATLAALAPAAFGAEEQSQTDLPKRQIRKAIMWGTVGVRGSILERMKSIKEAGFDGVEMMSHMPQDEVVSARDETGLVIPSVCGQHHWGKPLS